MPLSLFQSIIAATRGWVRAPMVSLTAIIAMAVGIGANSAVFSILNEVMFRLPPGDHAKSVRVLGLHNLEWGWFHYFHGDLCERIMDQLEGVESTGMAIPVWVTVTGTDQPLRFEGLRVTRGFFPTIGVHAVAGRLFNAGDYDPVPQGVMVLGYRLWQDKFGGDPSVIGQRYAVNGDVRTIVGILPEGFFFQGLEPGIAVPSTLREENYLGTYSDSYPIVARPDKGISYEFLLAQLETLYTNWAAETNLKNWDHSVGHLQSLSDMQGSWEERQALILQAVVVFILLIAVFNTVNLLLAFAWGRRQEMAIRTALGASPGALFRQALIENALLGGVGAVLGLILSNVLLNKVLQAFSGARWGFLQHVRNRIEIDGSVLLFTLTVTVVSVLILSLGPAWLASRNRIAGLLKEGGRGSSESPAFRRIRSGILIFEIALSTILLVSALLFTKDMQRIAQFEGGFNYDGMLYVKIDLPFFDYEGMGDPRLSGRFEEMAERFRVLPGVEGVTFGSYPNWGMHVSIWTHDSPADLLPGDALAGRVAYIGTDYFRNFEIPLIAGRPIEALDNRPDAEPVAVVTQRFVDQHFGGVSPLGRYVQIGMFWSSAFSDKTFRIVGVCGNIERYWNDEQIGQMFVAHAQGDEPFWGPFFLKTTRRDEALNQSLKEVILEVESGTAIERIRTVEEYVAESSSSLRFMGAMQSLFGLIAAFLVAVGILGVISYSVSQRMREMGIRIALGATPGSIRWKVIQESLILVVAGVVLGLAGAAALVRLLSSQLELVDPYDPSVALIVLIFVMAIGAGAALRPAVRASRADPAVLLRDG